MRVRPLVFAVLVVAVFLAPVAVATSAGLWATTGQQGIGGGNGGNGGGNGGNGGDEEGGTSQGSASTGEGSGDRGGRVVAPGEARGWMTLGEIADVNAIPLGEILAAFDLPTDTDPATALRDLASEVFSVAALRTWLAERAAP
jgi:hypothetical protein